MLLLELLQKAHTYFGFFGISYVRHDVEACDFEFFVSACDGVAHDPAEGGAEHNIAGPVVAQ